MVACIWYYFDFVYGLNSNKTNIILASDQDYFDNQDSHVYELNLTTDFKISEV